MRLTGTSFATAAEDERPPEIDFSQLIPAAVRLLTTGSAEPGEAIPGLPADELREQILAGYSHILVDEYQDVNQDQYDLISALSGRTEADRDRKLSILAVGDDDQTIYGWSGASPEFIRRFHDDYKAKVHHLVASYRSTAHILAAAERLISHNHDRMKQDVSIRVDDARSSDPPGGPWAALEPPSAGRVQLLRASGAATQAAAVADRLFQMKRLDPELDWSDCAVLARQHAVLEPIRSVFEHRGIPVAWTADRDRLPTLYRIRELATLLDTLKEHRREIRCASQLEKWHDSLSGDWGNPWSSLGRDLLREWREETGDGKMAVKGAVEFIYEALAERARETAFGDGVRLATVHAAKGLEFRAVFLPDGGWGTVPHGSGAADDEEERRLYYVGMTRARELLHLVERADLRNPFIRDVAAGDRDFLHRLEPKVEPPPDAVARRRYRVIGLQGPVLELRRPPGCRGTPFTGASPHSNPATRSSYALPANTCGCSIPPARSSARWPVTPEDAGAIAWATSSQCAWWRWSSAVTRTTSPSIVTG